MSGCLFTGGLFWYLSGKPLGALQFAFVYYVASHYYKEDVPKKALFEGMLSGMVESLHDKHSMYLNPEDFSHLLEEAEANYVGVGFVLEEKENMPSIVMTMEGEPAEKAGLQKGDIIQAVNGTLTKGKKLSEIVRTIRGKAGTEVQLTIARGDEIKEFTIERKSIQLPTVKGKMLEEGIGYIRISQFSTDTGQEFSKIYEELKKEGMHKLILDLRDNPGGLVSSATDVASYLLPKGPVTSITDKNGREEIYLSEGNHALLPLVVLVNENSASASEIIAGAVQDLHTGEIIGAKTYGKGTVQSLLKGPGEDAVKVTIAQYKTPAGRIIDGVGIVPDRVVKEDAGENLITIAKLWLENKE